jgi:hypothetical protein
MHVRRNTGDAVMRKYIDQKEKFAKKIWKCIHRTEVVEVNRNTIFMNTYIRDPDEQ